METKTSTTAATSSPEALLHRWLLRFTFLLFTGLSFAYFTVQRTEESSINPLPTALFLCLTIVLLILVSQKVGDTLHRATEAGVEINNIPKNTRGDWSALFFALAIFVWAINLLLRTLLPAYDQALKDIETFQMAHVIDALLSLINTVFFFFAAANIYLKGTPLSEIKGLQWFTKLITQIGAYRILLTAKGWLTQVPRRQLGILLLFLLILQAAILLIVGYTPETELNDYNWTYLVDSFLAVLLTAFLIVIFFVAFLERGYPLLSGLVLLVLPFVLFATVTKGFFPNDAFGHTPLRFVGNTDLSGMTWVEIAGGVGSTYKFIFVPLVLMLSITFFALIQRITAEKVRDQRDLLEAQNQHLSDTNEELERARSELSHRLRNNFWVSSRRITAFAKNERYANEPLAVEALGRSVALIDSALALYNYMDSETDADSVSIKTYTTELVQLAWISAFGHHKSELIVETSNLDPALTIRKPKALILAQLILEILFNISEHAYRDIPHDLGQRRLYFAGESDSESVHLEITDYGTGFSGNFRSRSVSYGSRIIADNVKKLRASLAFHYYNEEHPRGTIATISFPSTNQ